METSDGWKTFNSSFGDATQQLRLPCQCNQVGRLVSLLRTALLKAPDFHWIDLDDSVDAKKIGWPDNMENP